jgi:hypothetical protein
MHDVANDRHFNPFQPAEFFADRISVEQGLRGMFIDPISSVDDRRGNVPRQKMRRTGGTVSHNDHVHLH